MEALPPTAPYRDARSVIERGLAFGEGRAAERGDRLDLGTAISHKWRIVTMRRVEQLFEDIHAAWQPLPSGRVRIAR